MGCEPPFALLPWMLGVGGGLKVEMDIYESVTHKQYYVEKVRAGKMSKRFDDIFPHNVCFLLFLFCSLSSHFLLIFFPSNSFVIFSFPGLKTPVGIESIIHLQQRPLPRIDRCLGEGRGLWVLKELIHREIKSTNSEYSIRSPLRCVLGWQEHTL